MKSKTQLAWVKSILRQNGQISRNEALQNFVSRLGAIILVLKKEGWEIDSGYDGHRNYVYKLKKAPYIPKLVFDPEKNCMVYQQHKPNQTKLL
jgi:hypothetical protein